MAERKPLSPKKSERAERRLSRWGQCPNQGDLFGGQHAKSQGTRGKK